MIWEACGPKACRWNAPRLILFLASLRERVAMAQFRKQSTWFRVLFFKDVKCFCFLSLQTFLIQIASAILTLGDLDWTCELHWIVTFSFVDPCISSSKICVGWMLWLRMPQILRKGSTLGSHTSDPHSSTFWNWWHSDSCLPTNWHSDRRSPRSLHFSWPYHTWPVWNAWWSSGAHLRPVVQRHGAGFDSTAKTPLPCRLLGKQ